MQEYAAAPRWNEPNLAPTDVKRQHYVPEFFLKSFIVPDDNLRVVDLEDGKEFRTDRTNAAVESYFNDLDVDGEILSTEGWLSHLGANASPILTQMIENPDKLMSLSVEEEFHIARFIAALRIRTPHFRSWMGGNLTSMADQSKEMIRKQILGNYGEEDGSALWEEQYKDQPDYMWLGESDPQQPADPSTFMLGDVQGWANLLWCSPWRIGTAPADLQLYTSDNPVAAYQRPVREWWETAAFASLIYYVPLSPGILLKIERRPDGQDESDPHGPRRPLDFTAEEISVARHVITQEATRFLYGDGLIVPRDCATKCLKMIGEAKVRFAVRYLGYDPRPPKGLGFPSLIQQSALNRVFKVCLIGLIRNNIT